MNPSVSAYIFKRWRSPGSAQGQGGKGAGFRGLALLLLLSATLAYAERPPLDIVVFGASGQAGSSIVNESIRRGHKVTAVTRDASRVVGGRINFSVVEGNLLEPESVADIVAGRDIVILSVRGSAPGSKDPAQTVHRLGVENVVDALRQAEPPVARLLIVGGAGSLEVRPGVTYADSIPWLFKLFLPPSLRREIEGHRLTLDYLDSVQDIDWTYVSPAKKFYQGQRTGEYQLGVGEILYDQRGRSAISMQDYAVALLDLAEQGGHVRQHLAVASP